MPEGPEVRNIMMSLKKELQGKYLSDIKVLGGRYSAREKMEGLEEFMKELCKVEKYQIKFIKCKGKFIYFILENEWYLFNTLAMTGSWSKEKEKHSQVEFTIDEKKYYFNDARHFGTLKLINGKDRIIKKLKSLGPDIFLVSQEVFCAVVKKHQNKTLPEVLMNQKIICGIGNYIKSEGLYATGISPHRLVRDLSKDDLGQLFINLRDIVYKSCIAGGLTIRDYSGGLDRNNNSTFTLQVYGKKVDKDGNAVISEITKDKRMTHWVPELQN